VSVNELLRVDINIYGTNLLLIFTVEEQDCIEPTPSTSTYNMEYENGTFIINNNNNNKYINK